MEAIFKICKLANLPKVEIYIIFWSHLGPIQLTQNKKLLLFKMSGSSGYFTGLQRTCTKSLLVAPVLGGCAFTLEAQTTQKYQGTWNAYAMAAI